jgi:hypothetical protein
MPTLTDTNQQFALSISAANPVQWTLQLQQTVATPQNAGSATNQQNFDYEGNITHVGQTDIGAPGVSGFTLEATYVSILNTDPSVTQTISYGKNIVGSGYFHVSPTFVLAPGECAIFVKDSGWTVYGPNGTQKGPAAPVTFGDGTTQSTSAAPLNINACIVYNSQSQAVNAATSIQSAFDTVVDQNTSPGNNATPFWNPATPTYLTIPEPGYYLVNAGYSITPSAGPGQTYLQIYKKGYPGGAQTCFAQQSQEQNQAVDNQSLNASALIACVAGDQIYFIVGNSGPDNLSVFGGISTCYLSVALLAGGG